MKLLKRTLVTLVALSMIVTPVSMESGSVEVKAATAKKVKINGKKNRTIAVGETSKIKVKITPSNASQKVTYTSSAKKIAKVTKKGVIKAKKPGKAVITVKAKDGSKKKAKVKVTVIPAQVKGVKASVSGNTNLNVSWTAQKNVTGYKVYVSTSADGSYTLKATVKGATSKSTTIKGLASGTYYVKVRAYAKIGSANKNGKMSAATAGVKVYKLTWSDEFNGTTLDTSVWTYETGTGQNGWGNYEKQSYTAGDNLKFENGSLVIIPRITVNQSTGIMNYTSTRIKTARKKSFQYGKIEIRAKGVKAKGTWSAGWMLGDSLNTGTSWPYCGEIDIVEHMNGSVPQTIHCEYYNNQSWSHGNKNYNTGLTQQKASEAYHVYGIIWDDTKIQFTLDGKVTGTYDPSKYSGAVYNATWSCFKQPFFFILNCAIGGNAAGTVNINDGWTNLGVVNGVQTYEDYYYIDYVRVYQ